MLHTFKQIFGDGMGFLLDDAAVENAVVTALDLDI